MTPRLTVVGLGPAGPDLMTAATLDAIGRAERCYVRTTRHPAASALPDAVSFDRHYEEAATIEEVYERIVETLVAAPPASLYAVPGSPAVAERTVELLRGDDRVEIDVIAALSCLDLAWIRLGVDPLAVGARIVDGHRFATEAAGERGPLLVLQCDSRRVLSDIKLSADGGDVTVLHHLGGGDELIETVAWADLDRIDADHLTSIWIPSLGDPPAGALAAFDELVHTLREQCPWDRQQTHLSLRPYLVEETCEVLEAIDAENAEHLEEELGDLLFQIVFHATLAAETGEFTLADVARGIHTKLYDRHPHVFGGDPVPWEEIKRLEKGRTSAVEGIAETLPALAYAQKLQKRAAQTGFDWPDVEGAWSKVLEEIDEVRAATVAEPADEQVAEQAAEVGDLLFACVNVARHLGIDAETALRMAARKFRTRFLEVERRAPPGADLATLDALWDAVKESEA